MIKVIITEVIKEKFVNLYIGVKNIKQFIKDINNSLKFTLIIITIWSNLEAGSAL